MEKKQVVILGKLGSGKTTLFNKVTGANEMVTSGGDSATQSVFMKNSRYGDIGFKVLDTPGFGSLSSKAKHVAGVLAALLEGPLNQIFIIVKFDRTDIVVADFLNIFKIFLRYKVMVSVIVSNWDGCDENKKQENKQKIETALQNFKINAVIFYSKNDSDSSICQQMEKAIFNSTQLEVKLTETEILNDFDLQEVSKDQQLNLFQLQEKSSDLTIQYRKICLLIQAKIETADFPSNILADYLRSLLVFAKEQASKIVDNFEKENQQMIDELSENDQNKAFLIHFDLKKGLHKQYKKLVELQNTKLYGAENHCYKYIRKCFCGQIWIKVSGCDGKTICGRILSQDEDDELIQEDALQKFVVKYQNNKLEVEHLGKAEEIDATSISIQKNLKVNKQLQSERKEVTLQWETFQVGKLGCGRIVSWDELQQFSIEEAKTLFEDKMLDYFAEQDKEIEKRIQAMQNVYEKKLNDEIDSQLKGIKRLS